jgi:hypothetical protein
MTVAASSHPESAAASETGTAPAPRLLDVMRACMRRLGFSLRTEEAYVGWVRRFIRAHDQRHPRTLGAREVEAFLTLLATRDRVSASTQNSSTAALLAQMSGITWLIAGLLYGAGLRLMVETGAMTRCVEAHRVRRARRRQEADWRRASVTSPGQSWRRPPAARSPCVTARAARTGARCCRPWSPMRCPDAGKL